MILVVGQIGSLQLWWCPSDIGCGGGGGVTSVMVEKPRVKTLSYDFPKLQHSKSNSFCANVHLRQSF